jgi:hypothetical protein
MLYEYAVEPTAIGSSWQNFRYLFEKFGFDRGRLISRFPGKWEREVYAAATAMKPVERARLEVALREGKQSKFLRSGRPYDPTLGSWFQNAIAQDAAAPFHAIIAEQNPAAAASVVTVDEVDELHPLMVSAHTWEVERVGNVLAAAMRPLLTSARTILFVDRFFDLSKIQYQETLRACLSEIATAGGFGVSCEIHCCDHDSRPPPDFVEREAHKWVRGVLPSGMAVSLFTWKERPGGEDFHARNLLTDVGGMSVEAGFSAEGPHQKVQLGLLTADLVRSKLDALARTSTVYDLIGPVLFISADGTVTRK